MIACGMSGGVDSSVAAWLLQEQGHRVLGIFMRNWDDGDPACRSETDRVDALRVCGQLGIPFRVMDFQDDYRAQVFQTFLDGYARGITPNPDILCNREVKFGVFLHAVLEQGIDNLATGHYARTAQANGKTLLLRARDRTKDQSYFLSSVSSQALAHVRFPLGDLLKEEVRELALAVGLVTAQKKDSTGICFIGERDFRSFLATYLPAQPGPVVDQEGRVLGQHEGALYYTVGQRVGVGGVKGAHAGPWFVSRKIVLTNTLVVVPGTDHPALFATRATTEAPDWVAGHPPADTFTCEVQIHHRGQAHPARVCMDEDGRAEISFSRPVRGVAAGQQAAFYQGDVCLGGAELSLE